MGGPSHSPLPLTSSADSVARSWLFFLLACLQEWIARDDGAHQRREAKILVLDLLHYLIDRAAVLHGKFSSEGECQHFFGQATHEFATSLVEHLRQRQGTVELCPTRQFARCIDFELTVFIAPAADR